MEEDKAFNEMNIDNLNNNINNLFNLIKNKIILIFLKN